MMSCFNNRSRLELTCQRPQVLTTLINETQYYVRHQKIGREHKIAYDNIYIDYFTNNTKMVTIIRDGIYAIHLQ